MAQYNVDQIVYVRANDTSDTYNIIDSEARTLITELTENFQEANENLQIIMNKLPDDSFPAQMSGSTNTEDKLFLTGAQYQTESIQTYSNKNVYTENGVLYAMSSVAENNLFPIQATEGQQEEGEQEEQQQDNQEQEGQEQQQEEEQEEFEERNSAVLTWNDVQDTQFSNNSNKIPNSAIIKQYIDQKTVSYNSNWIDGLTTGAVRMINTKQEDPQHGIIMGYNAVSEGQNSFAQGEASYAQGINTIAKFRAQHVFGEYNIPDPSLNSRSERGQYVEIVGNGNYGGAQGGILNRQYTLSIYEEPDNTSTQVGTLQPGTYPYATKILDSNGNLWYKLANDEGYILGKSVNPVIEFVEEVEIQPARSNARTLDWQGNEALAGGLTIGGNLVFGDESQIYYNSKTFSPFDQTDNLSQNNTSISLLGMGQNGVGGISPVSISSNGSVNSFLNQTGNWSTPIDEKLKTNLVASTATYYPIVGANTTTASTKYYDTDFRYLEYTGTTSQNGYSLLQLGNSISSTQQERNEGAKRGVLRLYGEGTHYTDLKTSVTSADYEIFLPNKTGTIALTSDIGIAQTNTTTDNSYRVLLSNSANNTTQTSANTNKSAYLQFNPSNKRLNIGQIQIGGVDLFDLSGELTSNIYGFSLSTANATAYSSAWTPGTFRIQHWADSRGSGGTPQSTNYITEQAYFSNNLFRVNRFSAKNVVSDYSYMSPNSIVTMTADAWSSATNGVFLDNSGTIYLRKGSTTSSSITPNKIATWDSHTSNTGTVTSVQVQATSPVTSSQSTAQTGTLNTTIALANGYGDTKNPYGTKSANYVLAGPSSGNAANPTFRKLVNADIPNTLTNKALTNVESSLTFSPVTTDSSGNPTTSPSSGGGMRLIYNEIKAGTTLSYARLGTSASYLVILAGASAARSGIYFIHGGAMLTVAASNQCTINQGSGGTSTMTITNNDTSLTIHAYFLRLTH